MKKENKNRAQKICFIFTELQPKSKDEYVSLMKAILDEVYDEGLDEAADFLDEECWWDLAKEVRKLKTIDD